MDNYTRYLAGLAMARGTAPDQAFINATMAQQQSQMNQAKLQQVQQEQYARQVLPQLIQEFNSADPRETLSKLVSSGMDPREALALMQALTPQAPKVEENLRFNPVTGELIREQKMDGMVTGYGVIDPNNNMQGMTQTQPLMPNETPKESMARKKLERDTLEGYRVDSETAAKNLDSVNELRYALSKFNTGTLAPAKLLGAKVLKGVTGSDLFNVNPEYGEVIESKGAELVLPLIAQNKGAASDSDMKLFLQSAPRIQNTREGNEMILNAAESIALRKQELNKAAQAYQTKFGTLKGFTEKWTEYTNQNRLIQPSKKGLKLNKENIGNWKGYVLGEGEQQQPMNWSLEELRAAKAAKVKEREAQMMSNRG